MDRIVVGIDGSPESRAALRWAADEAGLREALLHVVYAYGAPEQHNPYLGIAGSTGSGALAAGTALRERVEQVQLHERMAAQERAEDAVWRVVAEEVGPDIAVDLEVHVVPDDRPARALVEATRDATLLVVGSRGRGRAAGLVLGSVSDHCVHHAHCPVTVVRAGEDA
jgi:nucleotide-binding universal stress UspA family protein